MPYRILCVLTGGGYNEEAWRKVLEILLKEYTQREKEALQVSGLWVHICCSLITWHALCYDCVCIFPTAGIVSGDRSICWRDNSKLQGTGQNVASRSQPQQRRRANVSEDPGGLWGPAAVAQAPSLQIVALSLLLLIDLYWCWLEVDLIVGPWWITHRETSTDFF